MTDYVEGELAPDVLRRFDAHLAICPDCVTYLDGFRRGVALQAGAFDPAEPVPGDVPEDLVRAILDARPR